MLQHIFLANIPEVLRRGARLGDLLAVPSEAMVADSWLSGTGAVLGAITVVGASLGSAGLWWVDPLAAAVVALGALSVGIMLRIRH